jgi:hypothetical protein
MSVDLSGVWAADMKKSRLIGAAPRAMQARIDHQEPELAVEMQMTHGDGSEHRLSFHCLTTGEEVANVLGGVPVRSQSHWAGEELVIESWMNAGGRESHFRDYWSVSADGRTLTMEHRDDDLAGQVTVLERV